MKPQHNSFVSCFTASYGDYECKCSHSSCSIFKVAYYYLYPFNIEYSLFASAMAYIMWKNVGRLVGEHGHAKIKFRLKGIYIGPSFGILLVIAGLATFIAYEMEMKNEDAKTKEEALMMYFVMNIVIVSLMSIVTVIGMMIYRVDDREHVSEKSPTRNLDVGLLVGASLGQFVISYFSIIAMISTGVKDPLNRLDLSFAIIMVIQLGLQNFFIIEGLHRVPFHELKEPSVIVNPYVVEPGNDMKNHEGSNTNTETSPDMPEDNLQGDKIQYKYKLLWKRQVLKEVCMFLLMGNIIVSTSSLAALNIVLKNSLNIKALFFFSFFFYSCGSCLHLVLVLSLTTPLKLNSTNSTYGLLL